MSPRETIIDGVAHVRSRDAAREVGLAPDYVSRLARGGLIAGKLMDGMWFVSLVSLRLFIEDQERQKREWRARLAEQRREEQRVAGHPATTAAPRKPIFIASAAILVVLMSFPIAMFAPQLPASDLGKLVNRIKNMHERGVRITSLQLKPAAEVPTDI